MSPSLSGGSVPTKSYGGFSIASSPTPTTGVRTRDAALGFMIVAVLSAALTAVAWGLSGPGRPADTAPAAAEAVPSPTVIAAEPPQLQAVALVSLTSPTAPPETRRLAHRAEPSHRRLARADATPRPRAARMPAPRPEFTAHPRAHGAGWPYSAATAGEPPY
jgi:hypothetical protein